jgi:hypothetical protein
VTGAVAGGDCANAGAPDNASTTTSALHAKSVRIFIGGDYRKGDARRHTGERGRNDGMALRGK